MQPYKLERDLHILAAMADQMEHYLVEDQLLWPLTGRLRGGMPHMTLGGYLLRKRRVLSMRSQLNAAQQAELSDAVGRIEAQRQQWTVHGKAKMAREWEMRLKLLEEFLKDCEEKNALTCAENWPNQAKQRTILHHLSEELEQLHALTEDQRRGLRRVDRDLRQYLFQGEQGQFMLADELQPIYPQEEYWWLWVAPQEEELPR